MREIHKLKASVLRAFPVVDEGKIDAELSKSLAGLHRKIVVLDDDPTGVQTVHDVSVYTDWGSDTLLRGFEEETPLLFFILTNSRVCVEQQTAQMHREIVRNLTDAAKRTGKNFIVISRSDSTLRGHYPLETQILKEELERKTDKRYDGEIIFPFF